MIERFDLHTHLFTSWDKGRYSLERAPRSLDYLSQAIVNRRLDGIALVNFCDIRFEELAAHARGFTGKYRLMKEMPNALLITDEERVIKIIRGNEIPTSEGHVLALAGNSFDKILGGLSLEETLEKIKNTGAAVVADHYANYSGIGKKRLVDNAGRFHAYELFNGNFGSVSEKDIDELLAYRMRGISVSDSHNIIDLGNGYIEINLDFTSEDNLRGSLREGLKSGRFESSRRKRNSLFSVLGHAGICWYDSCIRRRFGLLEV